MSLENITEHGSHDGIYERQEIDAMKDIDYSEIQEDFCDLYDTINTELQEDIAAKNKEYLMRPEMNTIFADMNIYNLSLDDEKSLTIDTATVAGRIQFIKLMLKKAVKKNNSYKMDDIDYESIDPTTDTLSTDEILAIHYFQAQRNKIDGKTIAGKSNADAIIGPLTTQDLIHASGILKDNITEEKKPFQKGSIFEHWDEETLKKPVTKKLSELEQNKKELIAQLTNNDDVDVLVAGDSLLVPTADGVYTLIHIPTIKTHKQAPEEEKAEAIDPSLYKVYLNDLRKLDYNTYNNHFDQDVKTWCEEKKIDTIDIIGRDNPNIQINLLGDLEKGIFGGTGQYSSFIQLGTFNLDKITDNYTIDKETLCKMINDAIKEIINKEKEEIQKKQEAEKKEKMRLEYSTIINTYIKGKEFAPSKIIGNDDYTKDIPKPLYDAYFSEFAGNIKIDITQVVGDGKTVQINLDKDTLFSNAKEYNTGYEIDIDTLLHGGDRAKVASGEEAEVQKFELNLLKRVKEIVKSAVKKKFKKEVEV